ncbi:geranylgeranyl transferase type-2 subunit alpha [Daktulosphaira vitifoliae]|uniref:geranylgeranyl transferase type-2 subunit alpha n=1 Tax=Daktulosphaira vitifoliae TaxID=58002 RepID=UPI0021A9C02E|nr:geranylgeranyl transferase type-2 subunit alpha [Daktulosphaira vitifoliae]
MHNRIKTQMTAAQKLQEDREKEKKLKLYQNGMKEVFELRFSKEYNDKSLKSSESLLRSNPDIVTLWNFRKEIFTNLEPSKELLNEELYLTEKCLLINPKSYSVWFHRYWILEYIYSNPNWHNELILCTKYLKMDERNFHCWDYRQIVATKCQVSIENELKFTMEMIDSNFSNYSAWHYRSKLLNTTDQDKELLQISELKLVENAAFTDPSDQSAWIYQRWLIGKLEPSKFIYKIHHLNNQVYLILNRSLPNHFKVKDIDNNTWKPFDSNKNVWFINSSKIDNHSIKIIDNNYQVIDKSSNGTVSHQDIFTLFINEKLKNVLHVQMESLHQLLKLEPESKYALLTYVLLLYTLKPQNYFEKCLINLNLLKKIDKLRKNYYCSLECRYRIEYWITNNTNTDHVNLSNNNLTAFYHLNMFVCSKTIDLSNNNLSNSNLQCLKYLLSCTELSLMNCNLTNLKGFPDLPNLKILNLRDNNLEENSYNDLKKCRSLETILLDKMQTLLCLNFKDSLFKIEII